jgi:hypothetical protein
MNMSFTVSCKAMLLGIAAEQAWMVWSDLASYPSWDPREEINQPNGPLAVGTTGTFKQRGRGAGTYMITAVDPGRSWVSQTSLPGGRLVIDHQVEQARGGTTVTKTYLAEGPMALAFRLFFARGIRREMPGSFAALETEIRRRAGSSTT